MALFLFWETAQNCEYRHMKHEERSSNGEFASKGSRESIQLASHSEMPFRSYERLLLGFITLHAELHAGILLFLQTILSNFTFKVHFLCMNGPG